jgi:hypothetical protein
MLTRAEFGFFLLPTGKILLNGFFFFFWLVVRIKREKKKEKVLKRELLGGFNFQETLESETNILLKYYHVRINAILQPNFYLTATWRWVFFFLRSPCRPVC